MENKFKKYDLLVSYTITEIYNYAKEHNNTIILKINRKIFKDKDFLYFYELLKMVQAFYDVKILINCNIIDFLLFKKKFKIKKYKTNVKRTNSNENYINFHILLLKVLSIFNENNEEKINIDIFSNIYDEYYNLENLR